ncbi:MAG TPA: maleylpyruvate isomerase N-terminal domain-containing protein [Clostridia bacterium]|nr:maleylpyruvate isomerase N-terminal domain-containing protein [Clostridia bacterium]
MYLDAMEFLEEERDAWRPFEALADLSDEQLERPVEAAGGWSGRDLMVHLAGWIEGTLAAAKELAVRETSPVLDERERDVDARGVDAINEEILARAAAQPTAEVRATFRSLPGELRGYLTVVPESRWVKNPRHLRAFLEDTTEHYAEHADDLAAILAAARE